MRYLALILFLAGCTGSHRKKIWIYTSTYKDVVAQYKPELQRAFPDVEIKWFQSGSEDVAARLTAELMAGGTQADLLMSSDIFFYKELKREGALLRLKKTPTLANIPVRYLDPDLSFVVNRFPVMVIAYNRDKVPAKDRPTGFKSLLAPKYKGQLTMASPLESGTALVTALYLKNILGADYFRGLRANDTLAAGGNGAVMSRIQSGERPVGIVLMENVLTARQRGLSGVEFIIPEEGALALPSPIAVFKGSHDPELAQRVLEWFLTPAVQPLIVKGNYYSAVPGAPAPPGAPAMDALKMAKWDMTELDVWGTERQSVKELFLKTVLK